LWPTSGGDDRRLRGRQHLDIDAEGELRLANDAMARRVVRRLAAICPREDYPAINFSPSLF